MSQLDACGLLAHPGRPSIRLPMRIRRHDACRLMWRIDHLSRFGDHGRGGAGFWRGDRPRALPSPSIRLRSTLIIAAADLSQMVLGSPSSHVT